MIKLELPLGGAVVKVVADLHMHSKYSRATSPGMELGTLSKWAKIKGIDLLGTGDFTHPEWFAELQAKAIESDSGFLQCDGMNFALSAEVSCIYTQGGRGRRVHLVLLSPSLEIAAQINEALGKRGNLKSDGRPIFGMSAIEVCGIVLGISDKNLVIPAHAWTPWFSVFGSMSGFDSLREAFGEYEKSIYAIETGLSCYDDETEMLTENGWKNVADVKESDNVCTINPVSLEIEYQRPVKTFSYEYRGKMYRLRTKRADLLVTPNHNLFYRPCDFRNTKPYALKQAKMLFGKSKIFKKDGIWHGNDQEHFILPAVKIKHGSPFYSGYRNKDAKRLPIRPWLKFFGFWVAEGWTTCGKDGDYNICVCNNDNKLLTEMKQNLEAMGFAPYIRKNLLRVRDFQLFSYLKKFGKSGDKFIPLEIKLLSKELLEIMLEYYIKGDGHRYGREGRGLSATTISTHLRDDLQEIALKVGMSAYYKLHNKKGTLFASPSQKGKEYRQTADSWVIYFIRKNQHTILPSTNKKYGYTESWVDYDGKVHCVSVPNHVVYIRRNGIPLWCGNSDPAMNWRLSSLDRLQLLSNSDSHSPEKIGREANVFDLDRPAYNELYEAIRYKEKKKLACTYEFYPEEGKYHYDGHRDCKVSFSPEETEKNNGICPVCKKPLTIGVMNRVAKLADRAEGFVPKGAVPFESLVPLKEIIGEAIGKKPATKGVDEIYFQMIKHFGNEFAALHAPREELKKAAGERIAEAIRRVEEGRVKKVAGFDGEYGKIIIFGENEKEVEEGQKRLGEF